MIKLSVNLEKRPFGSYDILIGQDMVDRIGLLLVRDFADHRCVIITDDSVADLYGDRVAATLSNLGMKTDLLHFPAGEQSKDMATALELIHKLLDLGIDKDTLLVALGGGVVGDITGFVASILLRSLPYVQIPTTLLAQVDSSIGGKTALDLPIGKNLIGTFHQPRAVFIDLRFLDTLPQRQYLSGLAEVVKYALIEGYGLFDLLQRQSRSLITRGKESLLEVVGSCCRIKKSLVEMDEFDRGVRRLLNLGHTIGHALEAESAYRLSHGEAVALGIRAEMGIAAKLNHLSEEDLGLIDKLLDDFGLPRTIPEGISLAGVMKRLAWDKKREGQKPVFVLLKKIGMPFLEKGIPEELIKEVLEGL